MVELSPQASLARLGEEAINALGLRAARCTVSEFILDWPIFKEKIPQWEWPMLFERFQLIDLPFEKYVAGGILKHLLQEVGPLNPKLSFPDKPIQDDILQKVMRAGVEEGMSTLTKQLRQEASLVAKLTESGFRAEAVDGRVRRMVEEVVTA